MTEPGLFMSCEGMHKPVHAGRVVYVASEKQAPVIGKPNGRGVGGKGVLVRGGIVAVGIGVLVKNGTCVAVGPVVADGVIGANVGIGVKGVGVGTRDLLGWHCDMQTRKASNDAEEKQAKQPPCP